MIGGLGIAELFAVVMPIGIVLLVGYGIIKLLGAIFKKKKECPFCRKSVAADAIVCHHCQRDIAEADKARETA